MFVMMANYSPGENDCSRTTEAVCSTLAVGRSCHSDSVVTKLLTKKLTFSAHLALI